MAYFFGWRISVLVISIASMVLTPADPMSMLIMAAGLLLVDLALYGVLKFLRSSQHHANRA